MAISAAAIAGGATLIGGLLQNSANSASAGNQMGFQAEMRRTGYQTAVKDMQAAGLNPMLAYSQGPAQTPGGAMAQMQNTLGPAVSSAVGTYETAYATQQQAQQIAQSKAQTELIAAQARQTEAQTANTNIDTVMKASQTRYWDVMAPKIVAETDLSKADKGRVLQAISLMKLQGFNTIADTGSKEANKVLLQLQQNEAQARSNFFESGMGQISPYVDYGLRWGSSAASILKPGPTFNAPGDRHTTIYNVKGD